MNGGQTLGTTCNLLVGKSSRLPCSSGSGAAWISSACGSAQDSHSCSVIVPSTQFSSSLPSPSTAMNEGADFIAEYSSLFLLPPTVSEHILTAVGSKTLPAQNSQNCRRSANRKPPSGHGFHPGGCHTRSHAPPNGGLAMDGWFYRQNGETIGPVSQLELRELVSSGQILPRQAVWKQSIQDLFFVCAATVFDAESERKLHGRMKQLPTNSVPMDSILSRLTLALLDCRRRSPCPCW